MALSEFEIKRCEKLVGQYVESHRPPVDVRNQVDLGFRVKGQSIELFELRADWQDPSVKIEIPSAKATYVKSQKIWKIYWMRADQKWHRYGPDSEVKTIEEFLEVVECDEFGCFFG